MKRIQALTALLALILGRAIDPGASALACSLPADPFVELRVSNGDIAVDKINNPYTDFIDWEDMPGAQDPLTKKPYQRMSVDEDKPIHFITLWDLTKGGTEPKPLDQLPADQKLAAQVIVGKYSRQGECLLPISYYFQTLAGGKLQFKLSEMISRSGRDFQDPLAVVDIGGIVKDGDYKLNGGADKYAWNDAQMNRDNGDFLNTFMSPKFPRIAKYNLDVEMTEDVVPGQSRWVVTDGRYRPQGLWNLKSYSTEYHMDVDNIGANPGSEENPAAIDPRVKSGDYVFTYNTPSDPLAYHVVVGSALVFDLTGIVWDYTEKLQKFVPAHPDKNADGTVKKDANGNAIMIPDAWVLDTDTDPHERTNSITVTGQLARSTVGLSKETRVASMLIGVKDVKPPLHTHVMLPAPLKGTTGETLAEAQAKIGGPAQVQVDVIDNNPFMGRNLKGVAYDPANLGVDLYYSVQMYDYGARPADMLPVDLAITPKFVWAKANVAGIVPTITTYKENNTPVDVSTNAKDADALYSVARYQVPIAAFEEPMGWHFATTSTDWGGGHKLKLFAVGRDGSTVGTKLNQAPEVDALPPLASASADAPEEASAKEDVDPAKFIRTKDGADVDTVAGLPAIAYTGDHAQCNVGKLGTYAFIDVYDNDRPMVFVRVTDTKYDKKVLFGNSYAGDLRRKKCQDAQKTNSNKDTTDAAQKPWSDDTDWDFAELYGGETEGYQKQFQDLVQSTPPIFKPAEYAAAAPADGPKFGMWVDEDVPLVFDVFARDNINSNDPAAVSGGWGITNGTLAVTPARDNDPAKPELNPPDSWKIFDTPTNGTGELNPGPWPQHIFRNPNKPIPATGDCHVELEVSDNAPTDGGGIRRRKLLVHFHAMDNKLKIQSLEETRVRTSNSN